MVTYVVRIKFKVFLQIARLKVMSDAEVQGQII